MKNKILIINIGSASKKYAVYQDGKILLSAHFEHSGKGGFVATVIYGENKKEYGLSENSYHESLSFLLKISVDLGVLVSKEELLSAGIRIVAPGEYFIKHRKIDEEYIKKLETASEIAPLHVAPALAELNEVKRLLTNVPLVGCSDSAYHSTLTDVARHYALPEDAAKNYGIYRYGYHGLSVESTVKKLRNMHSGVPARAIICHLGSGSSITALKDGLSVDTSMGFTPLEGVPMGSRVGPIDAEAVLFLGKSLGFSAGKLSQYLNTKSGMLGLSGKTSDIRELLKLEEGGETRAKLALGMFVYSVKKYIGAYIAVLGGLDTLVFTGTIGERSYKIRTRICNGLEELGIRLDQRENENYEGDKDGLIQAMVSPTSIVVLSSDEMGVMEEIVRLSRTT